LLEATMMTGRLVVAAVAATMLLLAAVSCGGSDDAAEASDEAVRAQVEEVCADRSSSFADRGEFPVEDFDPENPDPADLPAVGEYFAVGLEGSEPDALVALRGISATGQQREQLDALITAWEIEYENARAQVDAALASDVDGFVATLAAAAASKEDARNAASALGVSDCGSG
jgi:hypothetical protein